MTFTTDNIEQFHVAIASAVKNGLQFKSDYCGNEGMFTIVYTGGF